MALPLPSVAVAASSPLWGLWARPADRPAQLALVLAVFLAIVAVVPRGPRWLGLTLDFTGVVDFVHLRRFLTVASFAAAFLSLGYIAFYLHGGPRAPEAAALWLQGRALSHGRLSWASPDPTASFRATRLIFTAPDRLAGVGAPGYPLLLATGVPRGRAHAGRPPAGGVAGGRDVDARAGARPGGRPRTRRSTPNRPDASRRDFRSSASLCGTRRPTPFPTALPPSRWPRRRCASLRGARLSLPRAFLAAGFAVGVVLSTAPASTLGVGVAVAVLALRTGAGSRGPAAAYAAAGLLPGLLLLLVANRAATGHALSLAACHDAAARVAAAPAGLKATALLVLGQLRSHLAARHEPRAARALALLAVFGRARSRAPGRALVILAQLLVALVSIGRRGRPRRRMARPSPTSCRSSTPFSGSPRRRLSAPNGGRCHPHLRALARWLRGAHVPRSRRTSRGRTEGARPTSPTWRARQASRTACSSSTTTSGYELASDPGVLASHGDPGGPHAR